MDAGFCLFYTSERSVILSEVGNFVSWQKLVGTASAGHDEKKLSIPTVNFATAKYTSNYVESVGRETVERNFEPLQELDERDYEILDTFNPDRIIPFLMIDGQFMQVSSSYAPQLLKGMNHAKVKEEVQNRVSTVGEP